MSKIEVQPTIFKLIIDTLELDPSETLDSHKNTLHLAKTLNDALIVLEKQGTLKITPDVIQDHLELSKIIELASIRDDHSFVEISNQLQSYLNTIPHLDTTNPNKQNEVAINYHASVILGIQDALFEITENPF